MQSILAASLSLAHITGVTRRTIGILANIPARGGGVVLPMRHGIEASVRGSFCRKHYDRLVVFR